MNQFFETPSRTFAPSDLSPPRGVRVLEDPRDLLAELTNLLLEKPVETWPRVTIVLPTMRLRVHLLSRLTTRYQAFFSPRILNFEQFLALWQGGDTDDRAMPGEILEWLVAELLQEERDPPWRHLSPRHAHEAVQIFSEMAERGLGPEVFDRLHEILAHDIYRDPSFVSELSYRTDELAALYGTFVDRCASQGLSLATTHRVRRAERALAELGDETQGGKRAPWEELVLCGFTSMGKAYLPLWRHLARRADTRVIISPLRSLVRSRRQNSVHPLAELLTVIGAPADALTSREDLDGKRIEIVGFDDVQQEAEQVVAAAVTLVAEGMCGSEIAILVPDEKTYALPLKRALARTSLVYNAAIATPFFQTELGQWLDVLMGLLLRSDETPALLAFWRHPRSLAYFRKQLVGLSRSDVDLLDELQSAFVATDEHRGLAAHPRIEAEGQSLLLRQVLEATLSLTRPLLAERRQSAGAWLASFRDLLATTHDGNPQTSSEEVAAARALDTVLDRLEEFADLSRRAGYRLADFLALVRSALSAEEIREVGEPLVGVQILSEREARYLPFSVCFILGCVEASYPKALPRDDLLDDYLKERAGLASWQTLEAIQDTTFRLIVDTSAQVVLTYPKRVGERETIRSRFLEALAVRGAKERHIKRVVPVPAPQLFASEAPMAMDRLLGVPALDLSGRGASVSALEALVKCPMRYALQRLTLRSFVLPRPEDPRAEGSFLHKVYEDFLLQLAARRRADADGEELPKDEFIVAATRELTSLTERHAPSGVLSTPLGLQLLWHAFPAFAGHVYDFYGPEGGFDLTAAELEKPIEGELALADGQSISYWGTIDRLDRCGAASFICDYKRLSFPSRSEVLLGVAPQLTLYAAAVDGGRGNPRGTSYFSILKGDFETMSACDRLAAPGVKPPRKFAKEPGGSLAKAEAATKRLISERYASHWLRREPFFADPSRCGSCDLVDVCRRDDARVKERIEGQSVLASWLAAGGVEAEGDDGEGEF